MMLPIDDVKSTLVAHLRQTPNLVLLAPPGAGKTTRVPQYLVDQRLIGPGEKVLVLEPRRLAARLAAQRIAEERGCRVGDEVGYQVRFEDRTSAKTRIAIVTEGILTRRLQSDPTLERVGAVVLDEFHERSIHADLALAFLREIQETVRPELKIVVMSATFDPAPVARFLGDCPVVTSDGRMHPVRISYLDAPDDRYPVEVLVAGVKRALREGMVPNSDILAFLPGAGEIRRAEEQLSNLEAVDICPLYGELDPRAQDRAVTPGPRKKIILATNIAESSLTIQGVSTVVDLGLQKLQRHDPALGVDRLDLVRISKRSAEQRAGRAGRTGPGHAYRLWTAREYERFVAEDPPEIARIDLAPVVLEIVKWAGKDPRTFGWFEPPPEASLERATALLRGLGALSPDKFVLTPLGEKLAAMPLHPRVGMILVAAARFGVPSEGALLAALASERDVWRRTGKVVVGDSDLVARMEALLAFEAGDRPQGLDIGAAKNVLRVRDRLRSMVPKNEPLRKTKSTEEAVLRTIAAGFLDRVARRQGEDRFVLVGGGGAQLDPESVVREAELIVAVEVEGGKKGQANGRLRQASRVERRWLEEDAQLAKTHEARWNRSREAAEAVVAIRYGDLLLEERPDPAPDFEALSELLQQEAAQDLDRALPVTDSLADWLHRYAFLRRSLPDAELPARGFEFRRALLPELCYGKKSFKELGQVHLIEAYEQSLPSQARRLLQNEAPLEVLVPSGRSLRLRYEPEGPPVLAVRLQEIFGLYDTPRVASGRVPIKLELLAPNHRPVQVTQDLRSFWDRTYAEVRKELRQRYPKHQWPEDPRQGIASHRIIKKS